MPSLRSFWPRDHTHERRRRFDHRIKSRDFLSLQKFHCEGEICRHLGCEKLFLPLKVFISYQSTIRHLWIFFWLLTSAPKQQDLWFSFAFNSFIFTIVFSITIVKWTSDFTNLNNCTPYRDSRVILAFKIVITKILIPSASVRIIYTPRR